MKHSRTLSGGFTLIELLIVVAIIAILAAIAVPNFLEAQVRSKVSRVKSDMRTVATALEAYKVDCNRYPMYGQPPYNQLWDINALNPSLISTPIAYVTTGDVLIDVFRVKRPKVGWWTHQYYYRNFDDRRYTDDLRAYAVDRYGWWRLTSCGPDAFIFNGNAEGDSRPAYIEIAYDPTNGTVSIGDIERNQKYPEGFNPVN